MAIQARAYANKKAEEGTKNRVSVNMSIEDARALAKGKSSTVEALGEALNELPEVANAPRTTRRKRTA